MHGKRSHLIALVLQFFESIFQIFILKSILYLFHKKAQIQFTVNKIQVCICLIYADHSFILANIFISFTVVEENYSCQ